MNNIQGLYMFISCMYIAHCFHGILGYFVECSSLMLIKKTAIYTVNNVKKEISILNSEHYTLYQDKVKENLISFKLTLHVKIGKTVNLKWLRSWSCYVILIKVKDILHWM